MTLLIALLWVGLVAWVSLVLWNFYHAYRHPGVSANSEFPLKSRPRVSILVPARNESKILPVTLPALLQQDYDNYEVILVDDASEDGTGELAKTLGKGDPRLKVIRVEALPPGWVGKSHALHTAFEAATGEWVLATDADIVFHPKALRAGLFLAEQNSAQLVSIYAFIECGSFWERVTMPGFGLLLATIFPAKKINDPRSSVALASGGYILLRRTVWADLGGYTQLRSEMIDDLNTARIVKHSGSRIFVSATKDLLRTRMYYSLGGIWEGLRKNAFAGHRFSIVKLLVTAVGYLICNLLPMACLLWFGAQWLLHGHAASASAQQTAFLLAAADYAITVLLHLPLVLYMNLSPAYALLAPVAGILYAGISLDSMVRTLAGSGVSWKRRKYGHPESEVDS